MASMPAFGHAYSKNVMFLCNHNSCRSQVREKQGGSVQAKHERTRGSHVNPCRESPSNIGKATVCFGCSCDGCLSVTSSRALCLCLVATDGGRVGPVAAQRAERGRGVGGHRRGDCHQAGRQHRHGRGGGRHRTRRVRSAAARRHRAGVEPRNDLVCGLWDLATAPHRSMLRLRARPCVCASALLFVAAGSTRRLIRWRISLRATSTWWCLAAVAATSSRRRGATTPASR